MFNLEIILKTILDITREVDLPPSRRLEKIQDYVELLLKWGVK